MSTATRGDKLRVSLVKRYGQAVAELIYTRMRAEASGPFAAGHALHIEHVEWAEGAGVPPIEGKRKPPTSLPGAPPWKIEL